MRWPPSLIVFSGLPGVGKSTIARQLSQQIGAVYLRIDSIEDALARSSLKIRPAEEAGYLSAEAVAEDNLSLGKTVVADCVNPIAVSRQLWTDLAKRAGVPISNVEIQCTDVEEHRRRVESRRSTSGAVAQPTWQDVQEREYEPWAGDCLRIDNVNKLPAECVDRIIAYLPKK
ncbi:MAG: AAA family ATPase [Pseudomonadota bacterium]